MAAYITLAVGPDVERAEPVLISDDPTIIGATIDALLERMGRPRPADEPLIAS